ncbi:MAG: tRNA pseudouridine(13) synthase TruD [Candidatus Woesearchaeota archaeon]
MYTIKDKPEDFVVTERIALELDESGEYAYFWLHKRQYTTIRALEKISGFLRCKTKDIGFAGNKDKHAMTKQAISIRDPGNHIGADRFERFDSEGMRLEYIGRGKKTINLGNLDGNDFEIIVRDCDKAPSEVSQFINYYDEQRFSTNNRTVGEAILKKDFKKACETMGEDIVNSHLEELPNDYIGALKKLPLKIRIMYVHSYQSWLWNETVNQYLQCKYECIKEQYSLGELSFPIDKVPDMQVPIVGFELELGDDELSKIIKELMKREGMTERNFVINTMPELTAEGGHRNIAVAVDGLKIEKIKERVYRLKFSLQKGSYATMAVRRMMA